MDGLTRRCWRGRGWRLSSFCLSCGGVATYGDDDNRLGVYVQKRDEVQMKMRLFIGPSSREEGGERPRIRAARADWDIRTVLVLRWLWATRHSAKAVRDRLVRG